MSNHVSARQLGSSQFCSNGVLLWLQVSDLLRQQGSFETRAGSQAGALRHAAAWRRRSSHWQHLWKGRRWALQGGRPHPRGAAWPRFRPVQPPAVSSLLSVVAARSPNSLNAGALENVLSRGEQMLLLSHIKAWQVFCVHMTEAFMTSHANAGRPGHFSLTSTRYDTDRRLCMP
jgi:hypothetical protein